MRTTLKVIALFFSLLIITFLQIETNENKKRRLASRLNVSSNLELAEHYFLHAKYDSSLQIYSELVNSPTLPPKESISYQIKIANLNSLKGEHELSLRILEELICSVRSESEYFKKELEQLYRIYGQTLKRDGEHEKSFEFHRKALMLSRRIYGGNSLEIAKTYNNLAISFFYIGKYDSSKYYFSKALEIRTVKLGLSNLEVAKQYNNLGIISFQAKEYELALSYLNTSLMIRKRLLKYQHPLIASNLLNIGNIYLTLGSFELALYYLNESNKIRLSIFDKNHTSLTKGYNSIGVAFKNLGQIGKARKNFQRAYQISTVNYRRPPRNSAYYLSNIGESYALENKHQMAIEYLERANKILSKAPQSSIPERVETCLLLAESYSAISDSQQVNRSFNLAYKLINATSPVDHSILAKFFLIKGKHYFKSQRLKKADKYIQQAVDLVELSLNGQLNTDHRSIFTSVNPKLKLQILKIQRQLCTLKLSKQKIKKNSNSHRSLDNSKVRKQLQRNEMQTLITFQNLKTFFPILTTRKDLATGRNNSRERLLATREDIPTEETDSNRTEFSDLCLFIAATKQPDLFSHREMISALQKLKLTDSLLIKLQILRSEIQRLSVEIDNFDPTSNTPSSASTNRLENVLKFDVLSSSFFNSLSSRGPTRFSIRNRINGLSQELVNLNRDTAILDFYWTTSGVYVFVILTDRIESFFISNSTISKKKIATFRSSALRLSLKRNFQSSFSELYKSIFETIHVKIRNCSELIVIPDGPLNSIPFEAFISNHNKSKSENLLDRFNIRYNYSLPLAIRSLRAKSLNRKNEIISFAPAFKTIPASFSSMLKRYWWPDQSPTNIRNNNIKALPQSANEVTKIASLYSIAQKSNLIFLNENATETQFKKLASSANTIHLATHSIIDSENPDSSAILFYLPSDSTAEDDGYLYPQEIESLYIPADLVVLSSCDGAAGTEVPGEGIFTLARSFLMAGANSVVASLWKVPDEFTKKLMVKFHSYLLAGKSKAAALRQAKLDLLAENPELPPKFWAGFILIGS
ncbi:MAG: CHAT domain-containing protein [Calditrichia bacterium]